MNDILAVIDIEEVILREQLVLACEWLSDIAQVKLEDEPVAKKHQQLIWTGAIKGEYSVAKAEWRFFCPVWHTGQAVKALVMAHRITGDEKILAAARQGVEFITANTIATNNPSESLILAYEDHPDKVNTSAILECLDGVRLFKESVGDDSNGIFIEAAEWVAGNAWLKGEGLFRDLYEPSTKMFIEKPYGGHVGRPLLDDGILLHAFRMSGESKFRDAFFETADRLLRDEYPEGNWINYTPCHKDIGIIHPRHAYWWGYPMFMAYRESGDRKYLDCALRACRWYARAQRRDGGLIRGTGLDFNTDSFGHATSGIACAMIMFVEAMQTTQTDEFVQPLAKALDYCLKMQFTNPADPNLKGCILEKVLPPDGTDRNPYHIRDLGTIFFIQAVARILGE